MADAPLDHDDTVDVSLARNTLDALVAPLAHVIGRRQELIIRPDDHRRLAALANRIPRIVGLQPPLKHAHGRLTLGDPSPSRGRRMRRREEVSRRLDEVCAGSRPAILSKCAHR